MGLKVRAGMLVLMAASWANAATLPPSWQMLPTPPDLAEDGLPSVLRTPQLARNGERLEQVQMVVDLPFAQVLPAVQSALKPLGIGNGELSSNQVARIDQGWGDVLLARRPELKRDYLRRFALPGLRDHVREGALIESELPARMARLERDFSFEGRGEHMPGLQGSFNYWAGTLEQRHGVTGRSRSTVSVRVTQLDAVMGHPATAVTLSRKDDWPNPAGGVVGQLRALAGGNILSSGPSSRIRRSSVPQSLFNPVHDALSRLPGAALQMGRGASDWIAPAKPAMVIAEPRRTLPDADAAVVKAKRVLRIERVMSKASYEVDGMQVLADGSVLLVQRFPFTLMHWSPSEGDVPRSVWRAPPQHVRRWLLSADGQGQAAYLMVDGQMLRHDTAANTLLNHPLVFDQKALASGNDMAYFHDGNGVPLAYRHDREDGHDVLKLWAPERPAADGAQWEYTQRFAARRQQAMRGRFPGNAQLKPVQWDGPLSNIWVEDVFGLAELDGRTGRTLRVVPLPRRFGPADPHEDAGMAQWTPAPFGSLAGGWIAVGFVLMDGWKRNPGMHVVDVASGNVRYSLTLPGQDALALAVGSPDGRLLALGTTQDNATAVMWNLESGRSLTLQADRDICSELRQLQWSPDGGRLWGRCVDALVQWELPPAWQSQRR